MQSLKGDIMTTTIRQHLIDTNKAVLISVCCKCLTMTGIKAGDGTCGISHGFCDNCLDLKLKEIKKRY